MAKRASADRLFNYAGRATRRELGAVVLGAVLALSLSIGLVALAWGKWIGDAPFSDDLAENALSRVIILLDLIPIGSCLATASRRLHDTGKSAIWLTIAIVPVVAARDIFGMSPGDWPVAAIVGVVGIAALPILLVLPGEAGRNAYGPNPRTIDAGFLRRVFS